MDKDRFEKGFEDGDKKEGEMGVLVKDRIFEIPQNKSGAFLKQFATAKITNSFLEECRKSAIKTKQITKRDK